MGDGVSLLDHADGGFLAGNMASMPMTIYGDTGADSFSVYRNIAPLRLEGGEGNDDFIVRAFVLVDDSGSKEPWCLALGSKPRYHSDGRFRPPGSPGSTSRG